MKHMTPLLLSLALSGPLRAESAPKLTPAQQEARRDEIIKVQFRPRSSAMSNVEKKELRARLQKMIATKDAPQIRIYAWGDKAEDQPGVKAGDRDIQTQVELAEARGQTIRETLQGLGSRDIDVINAARTAGSLDRASSESQARPDQLNADHFSQVVVVFDRP